MFTEVNCSGLKDSRFNEQLLLAALKMFVRETQRKREREDPQITQDVCEATRVTLFPEIMKNSFSHNIYSLKINTNNIINKIHTSFDDTV